MRPGNAGGGKGLTSRRIEEGEQLLGTEPDKGLSTRLNRLSEIARQDPKAMVGSTRLRCEPA